MTDGRRDFDFLHGQWDVVNRRLADPLDPDCSEWCEFRATARTRPILNGLGNIDNFVVSRMPPDNTPYEGMALRLFNPETRMWRIWWASTRRPGFLDTPVEGRFTDGLGVFYCDEEINGRAVGVRFQWSALSENSVRWDQAFSFDGRRSWITNWIMTFTRHPPG